MDGSRTGAYICRIYACLHDPMWPILLWTWPSTMRRARPLHPCSEPHREHPRRTPGGAGTTRHLWRLGQSILSSGYNHCRPRYYCRPPEQAPAPAPQEPSGAVWERWMDGWGGGGTMAFGFAPPRLPMAALSYFFSTNLWELTLTEFGLVSKSMNQDSPFEPWGNTSLRWPLAGRTKSRARVQLQGPIARPVREARPLIQGDANVHRITECDEEHSNVRRLPLHVTARSA